MIKFGTDGRLNFDPKLGTYPPVVGAGGGVAVSAGGGSQSTGTVVFSNSNGVTFGLNAGTLTASAGGGAATNHSHGNPTLALTNLSGSTASNSAGLTLSISAGNYLTTAQPPGAYLTTAAAPDHSHGNPALNLTNLSGTTASASNGLTLSLSGPAGVTLPPYVHGMYAAGSSFTPGTGDNPYVLMQYASFRTAMAASKDWYLDPYYPIYVHNSGGGTSSSTVHPIRFEESGPVSINWNGSNVRIGAPGAALISHSHGNPTLALTNLTGTTASNSAGFTLSLNAAAPGAGTGFTTASTAGSVLVGTQGTNGLSLGVPAWLTVAAGGGGAGTATGLNLTNLTGTLAVNTSGVSLSLSGPAPGGGGGVNRSFFELMDGERITTCALLNNATYSNRPIFNPFWMDGSGLTCNTIRFFLSRTGGTSLDVSIDVGFYTMANATSMNLISSTRHGYSLTTSGQFSGIRGYDITGLGQAGFSLSEGRYVLGFKLSLVSSASGGLNLMGGDALNNVGWVFPGTNSTAATGTDSHILPFWGVYSATSANLPSAVGASNISGGNSQRNPDIYAIIKEI